VWVGNVRELKSFVEWAAIVAGGTLDEAAAKRALATRWLHETAEDLAVEALQLREALIRHNWDKARAARELGIHLATMYRRMKRHGIFVPRAGDPASSHQQESSATA
jgi:transcriptional regulator of acetoin/glycerol metabolism